MRKPRVLRIINRFNLGGPTYNVGFLTKYMEPEFETLLVGGMKDESEDSSEFIVEKLGLSPTIIPEMKREINFKNDRIAYQKLKQIIKDFKPDIVHTHASKSGALGRLAAHNCRVPIIIHTFHGHVFHSYFGKTKTLFYKAIERKLAKYSTKIIAISDIQKDELVNVHEITEGTKVDVIPLGFDLNKFQENHSEKRNSFRNKYNLSSDTIAIGIIGRLVPIKNHNLFLDSLKFVKQQTNKNVVAFIIGDGESRNDIEKHAQSLGLTFNTESPDLIFTSWVRDVSFVYPGLDIVALTSLNEGTPVSLIEAQASQAPIVSTNVGGIENIILPNETALLSKTNNPQEFGSQLLKLINDDNLRLKFKEKGWSHVQKTFSYNRLVSDMSSLYHSLLNE